MAIAVAYSMESRRKLDREDVGESRSPAEAMGVQADAGNAVGLAASRGKEKIDTPVQYDAPREQ